MRLIIVITGASGAIYALELLKELKKQNIEVDLIVTKSGKYTINHELNIKYDELESLVTERWDVYDTSADIASGSVKIDGMIIVPCTMNMIANMAQGISNNLPLRCADIMMKEGKKLVIVPRETPLNDNHLENMLKLHRMGVRVVPAMPGFYNKPKDINQLVQFIVARILDQFDIKHNLLKPWKKPKNMEE